jgi:hypothetical protein
MRSQRSILALRYTPVSVAGGVRKAVGGFLRYVQYRDQHLEPETGRALDAYLRYVAHRDRTSPGGRVFSQEGEGNDADRRRFVDFVARSTKGLQPKWVMGPDGKKVDRQRAVYTLILSPEDWRGLDLRRLARVAMRQLESDAGPGGIGPWFAAEHRNTAHHHVHIVLAARRELTPGQFSTLVVTRGRLQLMKESIALEIDRQRGRALKVPGRQPETSPLAMMRRDQRHHSAPRWRWLLPRKSRKVFSSPRRHRAQPPMTVTLLRLNAVARRYRERMERELEQELVRAEHEGWVR